MNLSSNLSVLSIILLYKKLRGFFVCLCLLGGKEDFLVCVVCLGSIFWQGWGEDIVDYFVA